MVTRRGVRMVMQPAEVRDLNDRTAAWWLRSARDRLVLLPTRGGDATRDSPQARIVVQNLANGEMAPVHNSKKDRRVSAPLDQQLRRARAIQPSRGARVGEGRRGAEPNSGSEVDDLRTIPSFSWFLRAS